MLRKNKAEWDRLERMEYELWLEENPGGTLRQFLLHLESLNAKSTGPEDNDSDYTPEEMERLFLLHQSRQ
jgi:hypothetical protein